MAYGQGWAGVRFHPPICAHQPFCPHPPFCLVPPPAAPSRLFHPPSWARPGPHMIMKGSPQQPKCLHDAIIDAGVRVKKSCAYRACHGYVHSHTALHSPVIVSPPSQLHVYLNRLKLETNTVLLIWVTAVHIALLCMMQVLMFSATLHSQEVKDVVSKICQQPIVVDLKVRKYTCSGQFLSRIHAVQSCHQLGQTRPLHTWAVCSCLLCQLTR